MMKRLVVFLSLFALLIGCAPGAVSGEREGEASVLITADVGPTLVVSSTEAITYYSADTECRYVEIQAGPRRSLSCDAPTRVMLETLGNVSFNVVDGYRPVTRPVVVR